MLLNLKWYDFIDKSYHFCQIEIEEENIEITLTELKGNLGRYVEISQKKDILITKKWKGCRTPY